MKWLSYIKQKVHLIAEKYGWYHHPKTNYSVNGQWLVASRGAFFRKGEKDDAWLYALSRHHRCIVDVGCNIGQSSLLMLLGSANRMLCIDPNPKALARCAENLIYNNLAARVTFINAFVGSVEDRELDFYTIGIGAAGSMYAGFAKTARLHKQSFRVKTRTLDTICQDAGVEPDLIKIDVEGAEKDVLWGIGKSVLIQKPTILVEVHSGPELSIITNTEAILTWCKAHQYTPYYLKNHSLLETVSIIASRGRYHLLLLPADAPYPDYLMGIQENAPLPFAEAL